MAMICLEYVLLSPSKCDILAARISLEHSPKRPSNKLFLQFILIRAISIRLLYPPLSRACYTLIAIDIGCSILSISNYY